MKKAFGEISVSVPIIYIYIGFMNGIKVLKRNVRHVNDGAKEPKKSYLLLLLQSGKEFTVQNSYYNDAARPPPLYSSDTGRESQWRFLIPKKQKKKKRTKIFNHTRDKRKKIAGRTEKATKNVVGISVSDGRGEILWRRQYKCIDSIIDECFFYKYEKCSLFFFFF